MRQQLGEYDNLRKTMKHQIEQLVAKIEGQLAEQRIQKGSLQDVRTLQNSMLAAEALQQRSELAAQITSETGQAIIQGIPSNPADIGVGARVGVAMTSLAMSSVSRGVATAAQIRRGRLQVQRERIELNTQLALLAGVSRKYEQYIEAQSLLETSLREPVLREAILQQDISVREAEMRYLSVLAEGEREMNALVRFRREMAAQTTASRYADAVNRLLRSEALAAYNARFDAAARYVYMAAKAYEYETGGFKYEGGFDAFLGEILRQRSLGDLDQRGEPVSGRDNGLVGLLAELRDNFSVFKRNSGFLNAERSTLRLSLREGLFRTDLAVKEALARELAEIEQIEDADLRKSLKDALLEEAADSQTTDHWSVALKNSRKKDLRQIPEFRRCCMASADQSRGALPGLVIEFETKVEALRNLFGQKRSGRDPIAPLNVFANRIEGALVVLHGFDANKMGENPQVFLVPVGDDLTRRLKSPVKRSWRVLDAKLPTIGESTSGSFGVDLAAGIERKVASIQARLKESFNPVDPDHFSTRLFGRALENTRWLLVIPGEAIAINGDPDRGIGALLGSLDGNVLKDIEIWLRIYSYNEG